VWNKEANKLSFNQRSKFEPVIFVCPRSFPIFLTKQKSNFLRAQTIKVMKTCTLAASSRVDEIKIDLKWLRIEWKHNSSNLSNPLLT
jgi:hypothetical protein